MASDRFVEGNVFATEGENVSVSVVALRLLPAFIGLGMNRLQAVDEAFATAQIFVAEREAQQLRDMRASRCQDEEPVRDYPTSYVDENGVVTSEDDIPY